MQDDHERAFSAIYNRYWQELLDYAYRRVNLQQDAEEIVQDVFVRFYQRRNEIEVHTSLSAYLYTAVRYKVYSKYREYFQKRKIEFIPNLEDVDYSLPESDVFAYKELESKVHATIQKLPEKCREAFLLSRNEQLSNKEIAAKMGVSVNTVEKHIGKALRTLRAELESPGTGIAILIAVLL